MGRVFIGLLIVGAICWGGTNAVRTIFIDPFGVTTRTEIRAQAAVDVTQTQAQAAVAVANAQAHAQIEAARYAAEAVKAEASEQRRSSEAWAGTLPILLLIVAGGGAVWLLIIYQGRLLLLLAQQGIAFPRWLRQIPTGWRHDHPVTPPRTRRWPETTVDDPVEALQRYADQHNLSIRQENGYFLLVDNNTNQVVKQLVARDW